MRKSNLQRFQNIVSGDMSQASITSAVSNIEFLDNIGLQLIFTGTPTGTFSVELSINYSQDQQGNVTNTGTWTPMTFSSTPVASGAAGSVYIDINQISAPWMRVKYTKTSGTGTLQGWLTAKMV
jgi:hypothetical protein